MPIGPQFKIRHRAAMHVWEFNQCEIGTWKSSTGRFIIQRVRAPVVQTQRLGSAIAYRRQTWKEDHRRNRHILPVYADFLYRLKHNALHFGYRFQHVPGAHTKCPHGCDQLETAPHLLWECAFASECWMPLLHDLQPHFKSQLSWTVMVFLPELELETQSLARYGKSLEHYLHVTRVVTLRCLWMHRNDIRFHDHHPNRIDVQERIFALIRLHFGAYCLHLTNSTARTAPAELAQARELQASSAILQQRQLSATSPSRSPMDLDARAISLLPT
ncbi:hypothetical protein FI667_g7750, partial [Globisporangium splendens]